VAPPFAILSTEGAAEQDSSSKETPAVKLHAAIVLAMCGGAICGIAAAEVRVHHVFDSNMVLQRDKPVRVWGWAEAGERVGVEFAGQKKAATAGKDGKWAVELEPLPASGRPRTLAVKGKGNTVAYDNVLVGDVWILGGQSNMEDVLESVYHGDVEVASANFPDLRLMTVPVCASPKPVADFPRINEFNAWTSRYERKGSWVASSPKTVARFSAIGYVFGRRLHMAGRVPIGLIDASRGGTTVEGWTSRAMLETIPEARPLLKEWDERIAAYDPVKSLADRVRNWQRDTERRKKEGKKPRPKPTEPAPSPAVNRSNPGASYNGMLNVFGGLAVKGAIFNQGYNNALGNARPALYAKALNAMIRDWRRTFRDKQMPFGIVELTAGGQPQTLENFERMMIDAAPFIREGQVKAWRALPDVGFACAYDQQVPWYHPHKKVQLGERIARWALATQYGVRLGYQPAVCTSAKPAGPHVVLAFDRAVQTHDGRPFEGFAVAGKDKRFFPAKARYVVTGKDDRGRDRQDRQKLEIWSDLVAEPVAVRYAWARNPLGNLVNSQHHERILPAPSFRTDDWDWPEAPFPDRGTPEANEHRQRINALRKQAEESDRRRPIEEAEAILKQAKKDR
jgi:sialate O-acetylesterase